MCRTGTRRHEACTSDCPRGAGVASWSCCQAHTRGQMQEHPKRQGQGPKPRSNMGRGAGEPAQIALCACAESSSRCSDGRPECLLLAKHCRKRGKSKARIRTCRSDQERETRRDRQPGCMASSPRQNPGSVGGTTVGHELSCDVGTRPRATLRKQWEGRLDRNSPNTSREIRSSKDQVSATPRTDAENQMSE